MDKRITITLAFISLILMPCLFLGVIVGALAPLYAASSNISVGATNFSDQPSPPLGIATIELTFTKNNLQDNSYSLTVNCTAESDEVVSMTYSEYQPAFGNYSEVMVIPMQMQGSPYEDTYSTANYSATYSSWNSYMTLGDFLEKYDPFAFPFDIYETNRMIIAFSNNQTSMSKFTFRSFNLNLQIPTCFPDTFSYIKELCK